VVIPNGVDTGRFAPDPDARAAVRSEWGVGQNEVLVGMVARLDPMKDHRNFLKAAARLGSRRPGTRFVCIGDGPPEYRQALVQEARDLCLEARLTWTGTRDDMPRVYNALDIAVSSSAYGEGTANTIIEAMATGVPCVVTEVGDSAAIVGSLGWVCPPSDSAALADMLCRVVDALPVDAVKIRERISMGYSSGALLERTIAELAPLIEGRGAVPRPSVRGTNDY
jgi:glycosyltransferase involved in cell wall biosynthesis